MPVTPKPKGRHHHGALRQALLDAAAEIVLERGLEAVTLRECARRAGVSHSAAQPHFGDKRGLLTAFVTQGSERLRDSMRAALAALPAEADARARLAAAGLGYVAYARANPGHFRLMFRTEQIDRADPAWREAMQGSFAVLEETMAAVSPAEGRPRRARLALAWAAVHGFSALRAEGAGGDLTQPDARAAEVVEDMIALLVAACAAE